MTGGIGREKLTWFYQHNFIHNNPDDTELQLVSRTVGIDRVVDEFIFKFTHDRQMDWMYAAHLFFPLASLGFSFLLAFLSVLTKRLPLRLTGSPASLRQDEELKSPSPRWCASAATGCTTNISPGTKRPFLSSLGSCRNTYRIPMPCPTGQSRRQARNSSTGFQLPVLKHPRK